MLPKSRVIAALEHRQMDRVPVGEIGVDYTITERALGHETLYRAKWKEYQAYWAGRRDEIVESYKRDVVALARKFEWDFVPAPLVPPRRPSYEVPEFIDEYKWRFPDGSDYCGTTGPMMSPTHFRQYVFPALKRLCDETHARGRYLVKHTDGQTWKIMPMMIEAGIDAWHGIQPSIGMDLAELKALYGDQICFFGGSDCDTLSPNARASRRQPE